MVGVADLHGDHQGRHRLGDPRDLQAPAERPFIRAAPPGDHVEIVILEGLPRFEVDLPLVLGFPALVRGQVVPDEGATMKVGAAARQAIIDWASDGKIALLGDQGLSLSDLYSFWTEGEYGREPYLRKLLPLTESGGQPELTRCDGGRLCRWYYLGEGLSHAPAMNRSAREVGRQP